MTDLNGGIQFIKGIGEQRAKALEKLEIRTLNDLVSYFPRDYQDRSLIKGLDNINDSETAGVRALVLVSPVLNRVRKGMELVKFRIADAGGSANVTYFNQSYVKKQHQARRNLHLFRKIHKKRREA
jgi:RecG-like helicase